MKSEGVRYVWDKYRYAALIAVIGTALMLWPVGKTARQETTDQTRDIQAEMEEILGHMSGVGQVRVLLTPETDGERTLARDVDFSFQGGEAFSRRAETVLVDGENGDEAVVVRTASPTYRGALVVCQGGDSPSVKLAVTRAVSALTGLPADRVSVEKWA